MTKFLLGLAAGYAIGRAFHAHTAGVPIGRALSRPFQNLAFLKAQAQVEATNPAGAVSVYQGPGRPLRRVP